MLRNSNSNKSIILWMSVVFNSIKTTSGYKWISLRLWGLVDSKATLLSWDWKGQVQRLLCWVEIERDKFKDCSAELRLKGTNSDCFAELRLKGTSSGTALLSWDWKGTSSETALLSWDWKGTSSETALLSWDWKGTSSESALLRWDWKGTSSDTAQH